MLPGEAEDGMSGPANKSRRGVACANISPEDAPLSGAIEPIVSGAAIAVAILPPASSCKLPASRLSLASIAGNPRRERTAYRQNSNTWPSVTSSNGTLVAAASRSVAPARKAPE